MHILQTERLNIRQITVDDDGFVHRLLNDPSWIKFIGDRGVRNLEDARKYISEKMIKSYEQHGYGLYLTELKENNEPIGICGLVNRETLDDIDIGFAFLPDYTGQGFGYESASAVMKYARHTLGIERIVAITIKENIRSIRLLKRLGLRYEKTLAWSNGDEKVELYAC